MVWPAKTSAIFLVGFAVSSIALPTDPVPSLNKPPTLSLRDHLPITFNAPCSNCFPGNETGVVFDLDILSTRTVCGETRLRLNDKELHLTWDGATVADEIHVRGKSFKGHSSTNLGLNIRALCIPSPEASTEKYAAQILAVTFHPVGWVNEDNDTFGFALSYNSVGRPVVFHLSTSPFKDAEDSPLGNWLDSSGSDVFHLQSDATKFSQVDNFEEQLQNLHALKQEKERLEAEIMDKDWRIRMHLLNDCMSLSSRLKRCRTLRCCIETSFQFVPDIVRIMKFRFGRLPSTLSGISCSPLAQDWQNSTSNFPSQSHHSNDTSIVGGKKTNIANPPLPDILDMSQSTRFHSTRTVIGDVAVLVLLIVTIGILFKECNSLSCRRRRVDLAARREERRTRQAYRAAARRHKFRVWWSGVWNSLHGIPNSSPRREYSEFRQMDDRPNGRAVDSAEYTMTNEIMGLRRALDYVAQLVGSDSPNTPHEPGYSGDVAEMAVARRSAETPTVVSSIVPLPTIGSPRTSTVLSYDDTDGSDTIESIDLETATMISG